MAFAQHHGFTLTQLTSFNHCHYYGKLMFLLGVAHANGTTIDNQYCLAYFTPRVSLLTFPPKFPSQSDWSVWTEFWRTRSSLTDSSNSLGDWLHPPHFHRNWFYESSSESMCLSLDSGFGLLKWRPGRTWLETGYVDTGNMVTHR